MSNLGDFVSKLLEFLLIILIPFLVGSCIGLIPGLIFWKWPQHSRRLHKVFGIYNSITHVLMLIGFFAVMVYALVNYIKQLNSYELLKAVDSVFYGVGGIVCILGFVLTSTSLPAAYRPELTGALYTYGRLRNWGKATRHFHAKYKWILKFSHNGILLINHPSIDRLTIVGPAAMYGDYEAEFGEIAARDLGCDVHIYASDISKVDNHMTNYSSERVRFTYNEKVNALDLITITPRADVIFDVKGALWHSANKPKKKKNVEELMMVYYTLLNPGGSIIIDSYKNNRLLTFLNGVLLQFTGRMLWYGESSTFSCIKEIYRKSELLKVHFEISHVEDGIFSVVALRRIEKKNELKSAS